MVVVVDLVVGMRRMMERRRRGVRMGDIFLEVGVDENLEGVE